MFKKYPVFMVLIVMFGLFLGYNSYRVVKESYNYSKTTYVGTVVGKAGSGRGYKTSEQHYIEVNFGQYGNKTIHVHPITFERFNIGDTYTYREDFAPIFPSYREVYDPKYSYSSSVFPVIIHALTCIFIIVCLLTFIVLGFIYLNEVCSNILNSKTSE